jgi:hypothetical protein
LPLVVILIVEFAKQREDEGADRLAAAFDAFLEHDRKRLFDDYKIASDEEEPRDRAQRANEELEEPFRRDRKEEMAS